MPDLNTVEYWYYVAGVVTPIITVLGFILVGIQIHLTREQVKLGVDAAKAAQTQADVGLTAAEAAKTQTDLMREQLESDYQSRMLATMPILDFRFHVMVGPATGHRKYENASVTNIGNGPAFSVKVLFFDTNNLQVGPTITTSAIAVGREDKFSFEIANGDSFEILVHFTDIHAREYVQNWVVREGVKLELKHPPRLLGTV